PAETAEHVRLGRLVDPGLGDRPRVEDEGDRQRADVLRRRRRTVVAGRVVAVERAVARRADEPVVRAARALAGVADRTRLYERPAGAARAIGVRDATMVGIRAAQAVAALARARRAIPVRAARRVGGVRRRTPAGVVDAGAARAGRGVDGRAGAAGARAVPAVVGSAATPHGHEVRGQ